MPDSKRCSKCGEVKALECFAPRAGAVDGRRGVCRECKRTGHKEWRDANRDHVRAYGREAARQRYQEDPEKYRAASRQYFHKNREQSLAKSLAWKSANRAAVLAYAKAWRRAHPDEHKSKLSAWREANPQRLIEHKAVQRRELRDSYVRRVLREAGFPFVSAALIDLKREQLSLRRLTKQLQQEITNQLENENGN